MIEGSPKFFSEERTSHQTSKVAYVASQRQQQTHSSTSQQNHQDGHKFRKELDIHTRA